MSPSQNKFAEFLRLSWKLTVNVACCQISPKQPDSVIHGRLEQHASKTNGSNNDWEVCTHPHCNMQLREPTSIVDQPKINLVQEALANGADSQASQSHMLCTGIGCSLECWSRCRTAEQCLQWSWPRTHIAACRHSRAASNLIVNLSKSTVLLLPMLCCLNMQSCMIQTEE